MLPSFEWNQVTFAAQPLRTTHVVPDITAAVSVTVWLFSGPLCPPEKTAASDIRMAKVFCIVESVDYSAPAVNAGDLCICRSNLDVVTGYFRQSTCFDVYVSACPDNNF